MTDEGKSDREFTLILAAQANGVHGGCSHTNSYIKSIIMMNYGTPLDYPMTPLHQ